MTNDFTAELDLDSGLIYNVEFKDGTTRLMRQITPGLRVIGYPWLDVATREVVIQTWLINPGSKGSKPIRFNYHCDSGPGSPAFGGVIVSKMSLAIALGDAVTWISQAGGHHSTKTGLVEEIVSSRELPDRSRFPQLYRSSGVCAARNHKSYVVRVPGKTSRSAGTIYWPRVSSITTN